MRTDLCLALVCRSIFTRIDKSQSLNRIRPYMYIFLYPANRFTLLIFLYPAFLCCWYVYFTSYWRCLTSGRQSWPLRYWHKDELQWLWLCKKPNFTLQHHRRQRRWNKV